MRRSTSRTAQPVCPVVAGGVVVAVGAGAGSVATGAAGAVVVVVGAVSAATGGVVVVVGVVGSGATGGGVYTGTGSGALIRFSASAGSSAGRASR